MICQGQGQKHNPIQMMYNFKFQKGRSKVIVIQKVTDSDQDKGENLQVPQNIYKV